MADPEDVAVPVAQPRGRLRRRGKCVSLFQPHEQFPCAPENDHRFVPTVRHASTRCIWDTPAGANDVAIVALHKHQLEPRPGRSGPHRAGRSGHETRGVSDPARRRSGPRSSTKGGVAHAPILSLCDAGCGPAAGRERRPAHCGHRRKCGRLWRLSGASCGSAPSESSPDPRRQRQPRGPLGGKAIFPLLGPLLQQEAIRRAWAGRG
jgi:hypothetical protein